MKMFEMGWTNWGFLTTLKKSVDEGKVTEEEINRACRRVLTAKHRLGLFEDPNRYSDTERPVKDILTVENRTIAQDAAKQYFVLLKNHNDVLSQKTDKIVFIRPIGEQKVSFALK